MMSTHVAQPFTLRLVVGWLAALALAFMSPGPATAQGVTKIDSCPFDILVPGQYLVTQDLVCVPYGIQIWASDVKLNVGGHTIDGGGTGVFGIRVRDATNVEIRNGTVTGYTVLSNGEGIEFVRSSESRVKAMTLTGNGIGVEIFESSNNTVQSSQVLGNRFEGILLFMSTNNTVKSNTVKENEGGIVLRPGATANRIVSNTAQENTVVDLEDDNLNCDANVWRHNNFTTTNQPQCVD